MTPGGDFSEVQNYAFKKGGGGGWCDFRNGFMGGNVGRAAEGGMRSWTFYHFLVFFGAQGGKGGLR